MKGARKRRHDKRAQQASTMTPRPNPAMQLVAWCMRAAVAKAKAAIAIVQEAPPTTQADREALRRDREVALEQFSAAFLARFRFGSNKFQPHSGSRECARRRRQMAAGLLDFSASLRCIVRIYQRMAVG